jgi:hypothetical protein
MDPETFDYHGYVTHTTERPDLPRAQAELQRHLSKRHGKGWEFECAIPGTISIPELPDREIEALVLVFRRRKEHQVTGVSVGGA